MPTVIATCDKILGFARLPVGWHHGEGGPISNRIIRDALDLNQQAARLGFTQTNAFAGTDGEIQFTIYDDDHYYEFTIERNRSITLVHEIGDEEALYKQGLSLDEALEKIEEYGFGTCDSSESSTKTITTRISEDLPALHSNLHRTIKQSQWLTLLVRDVQAAQCAHTSPNTTEIYQGHRLSTGRFLMDLSHLNVAPNKKSVIPVISATIISGTGPKKQREECLSL